jgi:hypothetical protein
MSPESFVALMVKGLGGEEKKCLGSERGLADTISPVKSSLPLQMSKRGMQVGPIRLCLLHAPLNEFWMSMRHQTVAYKMIDAAKAASAQTVDSFDILSMWPFRI